MVRAGVVDHPSKWPYGGYNEIQRPRRKNVIIAYERLRELAGFEDYASFTSAHRRWVHAALEKIDAKRESRWTESIAVGSGPFIECIKTAMGAMAKGRSVQSNEGAFELREEQSAYNAIFDPKNCDIGGFNSTGKTTFCSGSNLAHHPKILNGSLLTENTLCALRVSSAAGGKKSRIIQPQFSVYAKFSANAGSRGMLRHSRQQPNI